MSPKFIFYTFSITIFAVVVQGSRSRCCKPNECCYPTCCSIDPCCITQNTTELITNIWQIPAKKSLTKNIKQLRRQLISLSALPYYQAPIIAATIWSVDLLAKLSDTSPPPSCVFVNLISCSVEDRNDVSKNIGQAIRDYAKIILRDISYMATDSLAVVGCRVRPSIEPYPKICMLEDDVLSDFLQLGDIPENLRYTILKMHNSHNINDRKIVTGVLASFTESSVLMFNSLLSYDELKNALQYRGCIRPIPKKCCQTRRKRLKYEFYALISAYAKVLDKILSELRDK